MSFVCYCSNREQTLKKCTKCGIEYPLSHFNKDKKMVDGLYTYCCVCVARRRNPNVSSQEVIERRFKRHEQSQLILDGKKKCSKCNIVKDISLFYNGRSPHCKYYCIECSRNITKDAINRDSTWVRHRKGKRKWRNTDKVRKWAKHSISSHTMRGLPLSISQDELMKIWNESPQTCTYCNHKLHIGFNASVDRISDGSIRLCCKPCNSTKATRSIGEYCDMLRDKIGLIDDLREQNETMLKAYWASFIPYEILKEIASQCQ